MLFAILIPVNGVRERLSVYGIIGCLLIFAAIILAQKDNNTETVKNKESDDNKKLYNI
jgi:drug/metabolite transporter (DMT)-like permease